MSRTEWRNERERDANGLNAEGKHNAVSQPPWCVIVAARINSVRAKIPLRWVGRAVLAPLRGATVHWEASYIFYAFQIVFINSGGKRKRENFTFHSFTICEPIYLCAFEAEAFV